MLIWNYRYDCGEDWHLVGERHVSGVVTGDLHHVLCPRQGHSGPASSAGGARAIIGSKAQ